MLQELTPRQVQILQLAARAELEAIALKLGISENTRKAHFARAFERLDVRNMTEAVIV